MILFHHPFVYVFWYHSPSLVLVFGVKVEENIVNHSEEGSLDCNLPCPVWVLW